VSTKNATLEGSRLFGKGYAQGIWHPATVNATPREARMRKKFGMDRAESPRFDNLFGNNENNTSEKQFD